MQSTIAVTSQSVSHGKNVANNYDVESGALLRKIQGDIHFASFTPNGQLLAAPASNEIFLGKARQ